MNSDLHEVFCAHLSCQDLKKKRHNVMGKSKSKVWKLLDVGFDPTMLNVNKIHTRSVSQLKCMQISSFSFKVKPTLATGSDGFG